MRTREQIRNSYNQRCAYLRARRDLSREGLSRHLAKAKRDAQAEMDQVHAQADKDKTERRDQLERLVFPRLFGRYTSDSASIVAKRDALDRASRIENAGQARTLLDMAKRTGDGTLAEAIAWRAATTDRLAGGGDWGGVVRSWIGDNERLQDNLAELGEIDADSPEGRFREQAAYALAWPPEVPRNANADKLADEAEPLTAEEPPKPNVPAALRLQPVADVEVA